MFLLIGRRRLTRKRPGAFIALWAKGEPSVRARLQPSGRVSLLEARPHHQMGVFFQL